MEVASLRRLLTAFQKLYLHLVMEVIFIPKARNLKSLVFVLLSFGEFLVPTELSFYRSDPPKANNNYSTFDVDDLAKSQKSTRSISLHIEITKFKSEFLRFLRLFAAVSIFEVRLRRFSFKNIYN